MQFNDLLPELMVTNYEKSIFFYHDMLGWTIEYTRDDPKFAFLSYGKSQLMIQELKPGEKEAEKLVHPFGRGINFQIETTNVQNLVDRLSKHKYPLTRGIKDSWYEGEGVKYGCREILVNDPDGYLLRFSQDLGEKS